MRVLELFGGYGSQALALENLGIEFTSDLCDIDKYAVQAYNQLHGETFNYGDICSIDETKLPYYDLITYSSPCQDFSVAGKQAGGEKGSGTRSSLLWECERIIRAVKPKYLLMENVKALVSKKFKLLFMNWLKTLEDMGYENHWQVLNAKDYGVPQNRERVFVVSILGGGQYQFPEPIPLTKRLKDVLEQNVDEKYYISKQFEQYIENKKEKGYNFRVETSEPDSIRNTPLRTSGDKPCVIEPIDVQREPLRFKTRNGKKVDGGYSFCVDTSQTGGVREIFGKEDYRIRKLTPRECWRLMGVKDEQFDKLHDISNSQLYKMAGNSIVVDVLMAIFKNLFLKEEDNDIFRGFRDLL